ncbi:Na+/H+ antiporter NhaC family protein [Clostridiales bacterium BX7]|uniref:Na+/H+ antiporter NhaC family protein n=2 Tax=Feifania hominis TaxID=2763660 RepID=A0A926DF40_9FIRM|nr:Na+/H+ antiporter NhaC family protein [Feifania hominis]
MNADALGVLTVLPPLIAILLAFLTKNVVISLFAGIVFGAVLMQVTGGTLVQSGFGFISIVTGMMNSLGDSWNAGVVMQCLVIGGTIALITKMGGARAIADALAKRAKTAKSSQFITWLMGIFIFFDDYANSLIVGPVMRPVTDKMRISREKLSFIVDSTAAPIAGIALISTWIATELTSIRDGFANIGVTEGVDFYGTFVRTIPYRFYNIFILVFILFTIYLSREFGPMLKAERRARKFGKVVADGSTPLMSDEAADLEPAEGAKTSIWSAILPIGTLIVSAFVLFYYIGYQYALADGVAVMRTAPFSWEGIKEAFSATDAALALLGSAILATIVALVYGVCKKHFNLIEGIDIWIKGLKSLFITAVILVLAWTLNGTIKEIGTSMFLVNTISGSLPAFLLPSLIFVMGSLISFSTGTSYGTMLILTPLTIPLANALKPGNETFMLAAIGAVLTGAIFGDHCSPISDTTILSSMGAGCDHLDHTKTQMVYALAVAGVSIVGGYLLVGLGLPVWASLIIGIVLTGVMVAVVGKNPDKPLPGKLEPTE